MNLIKEFTNLTDENISYDELKSKYEIKAPADFNFAYDVVDRYAKDAPEKRALVWCDDDGNERTFTFSELSRKSKQAAAFFSAQGIRKGDKVMMILRRRWEFWVILLAMHRIGAVAIPATNQLLTKDIEYRFNAAKVKMIVALDEEKIIGKIEAALEKSTSVEKMVIVRSQKNDTKTKKEWLDFGKEVAAFGEDFKKPEGSAFPCGNDTMLLYFTSGTSGNPKMVQHNFLYPLGHITTAKWWQNVIDDGLHFSVAETGWAKAVWGKIYGQWICGSAVFVYDMIQFKPALLMHKIEEYGINTFCAPPTVYRYLIRSNLKKFNLSSLKYCVTAGEALNSEVYNKFYEQTGIKMFEGYGQTESTIIAGNFTGMEPKPGSMGKPAPGYDLEIIGGDGKKCAPGEVGSIVLKFTKGHPVGLFAGYYNDEELTANAFKDGLYHTGDTAKYDEDGYIWFVGRADDLIKTAGYRVSPFEVESVFQQHPAVLECAVTGIPDKHRGQAVKATVVLTKGYEPTKELEQEIMEFVKSKTASYKHPRVLEFVSELPKTISGKIRRVEIRENDK